jgi:mono/diheme cytochrome c family protein
MRWAKMCFAASVLLLVGLGVRGAAQTPAAPPESTLGGVYTDDQAKRGEESYMNICVGCHAAGTYVGPQFLARWEGKPLSEFFEVMSEKMPKDDPGSLELKEYAQIVAYILRQNKMPGGKTELAADVDVLKKIKFEVPKAVAGFHAEGTRRWQ